MLAAIRSFSKKELTVPVQKLVLQLTVMCEADSLAEAIQAYSNMDLEQIEESIKFGEDIGSGVSIVSSETIDDREKIKAELLAIGRSEEHTSELQSLMRISYAVFCLQKKKKKLTT